MGRWLEKITNIPAGKPTEPTQPSSVGFVGSHNGVIAEFVSASCSGMDVTVSGIIDNLLSVEDEGDILNGILTTVHLRAYVVAWLRNGAKKVSGKQ